MSGNWLILTVGGTLGAVGFVTVLWMTEPVHPAPPGVALLSGLTVSDAASLMTAVQTAGLRGSPDVRGAIDKISRQDDGRVLVKGWVADVSARSSRLTVMAFAGGRNVWTTTTVDARPDVARSLGLADAATSLSFQGVLSCDRGRRLIVIAVTPAGTYGYFGSLTCP